ncbi:MAG TPA: hypothetical protein PLE54_12240 [Burkholderiaceae bacterium]|nr:hypothetical protein [Burkholderiaceae bacterium]
MTFRKSAVLAMTFAGLLVTGAQAQVRTEPAGSVFVWEALGATPSIQLKRAGAATSVAPAPGAAARVPASPGAPNEFSFDALGATPQIKRPEALSMPPTAAKMPATPKDVR